MKTSLDLLLFTILLCATSAAQGDQGVISLENRNENHLHFIQNYEYLRTAGGPNNRMEENWSFQSESKKERTNADIQRHLRDLEKQNEAEGEGSVKHNNGKAPAQSQNYVGREVMRYLRAKAGGYMYIPH